MDSWTGRKRPWEEESLIDVQFKCRDSTTAAGERPTPPLPQHAGYYSRDSEALSQRRLPPLYTPSCRASAEHFTSGSLQVSPSGHESVGLDKSRPRSQSLYDVFQQSKRQRHDGDSERTITFSGARDLDRSLPPIGTDARRPCFGTDPAPHAAGAVICCPSNCSGQACSNARTLMRKLASELIGLDTKVRSILQTDHHSSNEPPEFEHIGTEGSLQWALDLVQWANLKLRDHLDTSTSRSPEHDLFLADTSTTMRRGRPHLDREDQSPPTRQLPGPPHGHSGFAHPAAMSEDSRRNLYGNEMTPMANSLHHTASSSGLLFMPPQSPLQAPQSSRAGLLPSPSSMNFPNVPNLPPISPPSSSVQTSAQAAHLQDLQHQVSIKTLAFQTLQREYDSLLQKLERQRTKCATLEKKFEVSDIEINSLTDEKEKLQAQVTTLESQVEELQQSRDEARRQLVANGGQYMRIMEMANRLQAQSADDKRRWEAEKAELEQRIKVLEEAMVTGTERLATETGHATVSSPSASMSLATHNLTPSSASASSPETINVLRAEIGRLRSRTQRLEIALHTMREESVSIQAAARQLVESGGKIEMAVDGAVGG
ncbi:hypothetical protein K469DRAFT_173320 [Zopfia rhizophila CBS 207.26]|uniref:Uncharacterized protein n=1 Tax=Zopfia rhizophila CBS 207.26 TaxID=1314779 RepID=A0A6A6DYV5_9PEZI|nr:hypothetical protein K469DRAFT_173320 [Zopfia rhizophila CBS 207.26]